MSRRGDGIFLLETPQILFYQGNMKAALESDPALWSRRFQDVDEIWGLAFSGALQIWAVCDDSCLNSIFMTEIVNKPRNVLRVIMAFGQKYMSAIDDIDAVITAFAKEMGCDEIEIVGRKGWERVFKARGVKHIASTFLIPVHHRRGH